MASAPRDDLYSPDFRATTRETYAHVCTGLPIFRSLAELPVAWDV
jgi:hypothetical protein